ncbi:MAG: hypothetical protein JOZ15_17845 [Acidobacteria bacterium]|nr:hypothetical protein [Acidobacteriota bacterium]
MSRGNLEDVFPLSPLQEGILFQALCHPGSGVYVTQLGWRLRGELDGAALRRAWQAVADRHRALRTGFVWESRARPLQVVVGRVAIGWQDEDWRGLEAAEQERAWEQLLAADRERGFDLARPPLARLSLLRLAERDHRLLFSFHHAVLDGWSTATVLREVFGLFAAECGGPRPALAPPPSYRDYVSWLRRQDLSGAEPFFRQRLSDLEAPTPLGIDRPGVRSGPPRRHVKWQWPLGAPLAASLALLARRHRLTQSTLMHGAWALLLGRSSGRDDVVFGTLLSGRPAALAGSEDMVGLFINTLPLRVALPARQALPAWLSGLNLELARLREHGHCPLVDVQRWSAVPRTLPLFESVLIFDNVGLVGLPAGVELPPGLHVDNDFGADQNNLPLTLTVRPDLIDFEYDPDRFHAEAVARLGEELGILLGLLVGMPEACLGEIADRLQEIAAERRSGRVASRARRAFEKLQRPRPGAAAHS